jgi:hypothetical protein
MNVRTSSRLAAIAAIGVNAWSMGQAAAPSRLSAMASQAGQTTDVATGTSPTQQGARPALRGGVELIQLDVSVLDRKRQPVTGLTASDFTVFDNGLQRPIRAFTAIRLPAGRALAGVSSAASVDVVSNEVGAQEGRLVVIVMDRTIPPGQPTIAARKIATAAVEALGPYDLARWSPQVEGCHRI